MSRIRLSFGSRAGGSTDYQGHDRRPAFSSRGPLDTLEALTAALQAEIELSARTSVPECTTSELFLCPSAILPLARPSIGPYSEGGAQDLPVTFKESTPAADDTPHPVSHPHASCAAIVNVVDPRERQIVQRAASRGIMAAIEAVDGFRYSFNNAWTAKDEEGSRFSYICQDSMQNKDRHANAFTRTLKHLKGDGGSGVRKPTYDCKGSVSVKFSTNRQSVDVYYRHYAIHDTVANRKPMPRKSRASGGLAATLQAESMGTSQVYASSALSIADVSHSVAGIEPSNIGRPLRPLKRKREPGPPPPPPPIVPEKLLSLAELLKQSETASAPTTTFDTKNSSRQPSAPSVAYELPSWQTPPPKLNVQPLTAPYPGPYRPPYQPKAQRKKQNVPAKVLATPAAPQPPQNLNFGLVRGEVTGPSHPQSQGLFTTMKPTMNDITIPSTYRRKKSTPTNLQATSPPTYSTTTTSSFIQQPAVSKTPQDSQQTTFSTPQEQNAANYRRDAGPMTFNTFSQPTKKTRSCVTCQIGKRKCDERRPICTTCVKSGRTECVFDGAADFLCQSNALLTKDNPGPGMQNDMPLLSSWGNATMAPATEAPVRRDSSGTTEMI